MLFCLSIDIKAQKDESLTDFKFFRCGMYGTLGPSWMKPDMKDWKNEGMRFGYGFGFMAEFADVYKRQLLVQIFHYLIDKLQMVLEIYPLRNINQILLKF